jgi:hypothetical protein
MKSDTELQRHLLGHLGSEPRDFPPHVDLGQRRVRHRDRVRALACPNAAMPSSSGLLGG